MIKLKLNENELEIVEKIIIRSIQTRVEKTGTKGAIVALSGGIDSSLVAVLTHKALADGVIALIMPETEITPEEDLNDALELAKKYEISYRTIYIDTVLKWFEKQLPNSGIAESEKRYTMANVKPRVRMILNYMHANLLNRIVVGTSNKTELLLGYGTKYGDLAADIYPIGDLYKTQVWQLAEFLGIPTEIIKKVPTAGLWKGQTDEQELGHTYQEIDRVLYALVELELSVRETSELLKIDEEAILDIHERILRSEHKRKIPTITRLSKMCLDKDWRYPVERY